MDRTTALRKIFEAILRGSLSITPQRSAHFLDAVTSHEDSTTCVSKLISSKAGLSALQDCMRYDLSPKFLNGRGADILRYLQDPRLKDIAGGMFLQQVLTTIVEPPIFWHALVANFRNDSLEEKGQIAFAGLFLQLLSLSDVDEDHLALTVDDQVMNRILESPFPAVCTFGAKIQSVLSASAAGATVVSGCFRPGGRHDNDFADFREIAVLPTAAEISSEEEPFIRKNDCLEDPGTLQQREEIYLDNQYRLLREDMLHELREEVQIALKQKRGFHRGLILDGFKVLDTTHTGPDEKRSKWAIALQCEFDPWIFKKVKAKERKAFLDDNRTRYFRHQTLACLMVNDEIVAFPTLNRDENLLAKKPSILVLQLEGYPIVQALTKLKLAQSHQIRVILIDTAVFSFEPILQAIKDTKSIPLAPEILFWDKDSVMQGPQDVKPELQALISTLRVHRRDDLQTHLNTSKSIILDKSQHASLLSALTQNVSLIQGPPGTGKSFIGALLAKIIHDFSSKTILVVCYTNHALDQFLEDLLDIGIPSDDIVRLGGKSTVRTEPLALTNLQKRRLSPKLTRVDWSHINALKSEASKHNAKLQTTFKRYASNNMYLGNILGHLEVSDDVEDMRFYDALSVPDAEKEETYVGKKGKKVGPTYLIEAWVKNQPPGIFANHPRIMSARSIWTMPPEARQACITRWKTSMARDVAEHIYSLVQKYNTCLTQIEATFMRKDGELVGSKRIIGCTTTAAAKYNEYIRMAKPGVLLVEEAGEILESHVLTSLNPNSNQLVLIGDHKQLRPKVNDYRLTVEKGEGYDLNMSLFERLILKGYPHTTLQKQHRMRPEISTLIRELTYPELVDAPRTQNRPPLRGLQDVVVFVNHTHQEDEVDVTDRQDNTATSSKENTYEVEMVLKIVRYLAQQGYRTDEMTVLTPYLGQLQKLRRALAAENDPVLNDLDTHDLVRAGLIPAATGDVAKRKIRLATIDNYQGEECDIIIASLTRSNPNRDIGFMCAPERLNVLLSRARNGLIMLGNAETFSKARRGSELWTKFFELLKRDRHIYAGLPIKCERHPDRMSVIQNAIDFDTETPDGGCVEDCGSMLNCGLHKCPSRCHQLADHSKMACEAIAHSKCLKNHNQQYRCSEGRPLACKKCNQEAAEVKNKQERALRVQREQDAQKAKYDQQLRELNDKIASQMEASRSAEESRKRQEVIEQKKRDLEDITARNANRTSGPSTTLGSPSLQRPVSNLFQAASLEPTVTPAPTAFTSPISAVKSSTAPLNPSASFNPPPPVPSNSSTGLSPSEVEWQRQKDMEGASNEAIDKLMELTGLEEVKSQILTIKAKIDLVTRQNTSTSDERFNVCMLGNPGTGKTTVARIYAQFLSSVGILPGSEFIESTGSRLANDGISGIKAHIEGVLNAGGGTIFIDEAYQLVSEHNISGSQVLDFILAEMENNIGKLVFILAGYNKQMEKFFEHNPGLLSRVPYTLNFKDYTDEQLVKMLKRLIEKKYQGKMDVEGGLEGLYARIAARRLGRGRNRAGFGNARALENVFNKILERQAKRIQEERKNGIRPNDFLLVKEDLIGPEPSGALERSPSWIKLQKLIGLSAVKETVHNLIDSLRTNYLCELKENKPLEVSLNRVFTGSPGTGKTTVAKLYGQILTDLGLLSNGEVVVKNPADFVGSHLGQSEANTKAILASSVGKVLVIDEAYGLYGGASQNGSDIYKTAVIDTIVAEVQSEPGEDRCVLLLGYRKEMEEMFRNVNPGLSRRFAIDSPFQFDDFTEDELMEVLDLKLRESDLDASSEAKVIAREFLGRARNRPKFGNGGDVQNMIDKAKLRYLSRQASLPLHQRPDDIVFQPVDFDPEHDRQSHASTNLAKLFEDIVGCDEIVEKLRKYQRIAMNAKRAGKDARKQIPTCFIFKGPPGTGKTTVARKMGQVFYDIGFLSSKEVIECSASDLVGQYVGHTGPKVQKKFEQALGSVLFIDEAYRLSEGNFAQEAVDEIVGLLTKEEFMSKLVVILAGYEDHMNRLMEVNAGLSSRFPEAIVFHNMDHAHCLKVLDKTLRADDVVLEVLRNPSSNSYSQMTSILEQISALPGWGNIRDVMTLAKKMTGEAYSNQSTCLTLSLSSEQAISIMSDMLVERQNRFASQFPLTYKTPTAQKDFLSPLPPLPPASAPPISTSTSTCSSKPKPGRDPKVMPQDPVADPKRDAGVSDAVWHQLQIDQRAADEKAQQITKLERQAQEMKEQGMKDAAQAALLKQQAKVNADDAAKLMEFKRQQEEMRLRALRAQAERRKLEDALEARKEEEMKEARAQRKLRSLGVCVAGYRWIKQSDGYRCAGGAHFVYNAALED
ncbi:P-loop containing nucleoside triphosphate hydrolase protein [Lentinula aff. detonsa]|uniref:P-loop containing nucleoside triphosphate hydrolase protein n=1 Tax=Lentinula aff. detonsa TaxID=2804958 RepID=A0AA38NNZ0_9AGAR|nr:P-loop containing nucleoside triphosphate hydrolase protein [Lentinula aff. detonsa]